VSYRPWLEESALRQMAGLPDEAFDTLVRLMSWICDDRYDRLLSVAVTDDGRERMAELGGLRCPCQGIQESAELWDVVPAGKLYGPVRGCPQDPTRDRAGCVLPSVLIDAERRRGQPSAFGLISSVVAVSQSRENSRLPRISVGWCSPRYMRDRATRTGMAMAGMRNSHRHQPRAWPMTRIAMAT